MKVFAGNIKRYLIILVPAILLFAVAYYGVYKPYQRKREELKTLYEENKKLRDEYKRKADELKKLMKEEEKINKELTQLKNRLSVGGDQKLVQGQIKTLLSEKAKIYGLVETSFSEESIQDMNGIKKVIVKAKYTSQNVENILKFLRDIEANGLIVDDLSMGVDNPNAPTAYYVEVRVYRLWIPQ
jgi:Tfp pilus assembly protein PilO